MTARAQVLRAALLVGLSLVCGLAAPEAYAQQEGAPTAAQARTGTGGVNPVPPKAIAPLPPTLQRGPWARLVVVQIVSEPFRPAILRTRGAQQEGAPTAAQARMGTGGVSPVPPKAIAPLPPTLQRGPWARLVVVQVVSEPFRPVVLRTRDGQLAGVLWTDERGRLELLLPAVGLLLDVPGTAVRGWPLLPGQALTLVTG